MLRFDCAMSKCQACGNKQLFNNPDCIIENDNTKIISYKVYENSKPITADGSVGKFAQKVLISTHDTFKNFFKLFQDHTQNFLSHNWFKGWDRFHRDLFFDGLADNILAIHTDFSATYTCGGQDEGTCVQPNTAAQQVFVVSFMDAETKKQVNEAWHFWAEINSESPPTNYIYDYNCKVIMLYYFYKLI